MTLLAWTADEGRPAGVLWLENRTDGAGSLHRRYRGWRLDGDSVRGTLSVADSLAVPAAAWRPLPAPGLRLSVDPRGRISAVETSRDGGSRIELGTELASWRGATGRRQRLVRGRLGRGDPALPAADSAAEGTRVTAAVLRFERLAGEPGTAGPARVLLLAGRGGRGLLALDGGADRPWSRAWWWAPDGRAGRLDAAALPDTSEGAAGWRFGAAGAAGAGPEWHVPATGDSTAAGEIGRRRPDGFRLSPVAARLREGRGARPAGGFLLLSPPR